MQYQEGEDFQPEGNKCTKCSCVVSTALSVPRAFLLVNCGWDSPRAALTLYSLSSPSSCRGTKGKAHVSTAGFWASVLLTLWDEQFFERGAVPCIVGCLMALTSSVVTTKHACRHCYMSPGEQGHSWWRTTGLKSEERCWFSSTWLLLWEDMDSLLFGAEKLLTKSIVEFFCEVKWEADGDKCSLPLYSVGWENRSWGSSIMLCRMDRRTWPPNRIQGRVGISETKPQTGLCKHCCNHIPRIFQSA